jgi:hypothetical protein
MTAPQQHGGEGSNSGQPNTAPAPTPPPGHNPGVPGPGQIIPGQISNGPGQPNLAYPPPATGATGNNENGYPDHTPVQAMNAEQQAAYWRTYARRNEDRIKQMGDYQQLKEQADAYSKLLAETQTEQQKAVTAAEARGRTAALAEAGSQMVEAYVRAAATGRMSEEQVSTLLQGLDRTRFVNPGNGQVDAAMISGYIAMLAPAAPMAGWPGAPVYAPPVPATGQVQMPPGTTFTNAPPGQQPLTYPGQQPGYGQQPYPQQQQQPGQAPWSVYPPQQQPQQPQQPATPPAMGDGRQVPSYGQAQFATPPASGFEAGKAVARARFAKPATQ